MPKGGAASASSSSVSGSKDVEKAKRQAEALAAWGVEPTSSKGGDGRSSDSKGAGKGSPEKKGYSADRRERVSPAFGSSSEEQKVREQFARLLQQNRSGQGAASSFGTPDRRRDSDDYETWQPSRSTRSVRWSGDHDSRRGADWDWHGDSWSAQDRRGVDRWSAHDDWRDNSSWSRDREQEFSKQAESWRDSPPRPGDGRWESAASRGRDSKDQDLVDMQMRNLVGRWVDVTSRSRYEVKYDWNGRSLSVRTHRPGGKMIVTQALIRKERGRIVWGQGPSFCLGNADGSAVWWEPLKPGMKRFFWVHVEKRQPIPREDSPPHRQPLPRARDEEDSSDEAAKDDWPTWEEVERQLAEEQAAKMRAAKQTDMQQGGAWPSWEDMQANADKSSAEGGGPPSRVKQDDESSQEDDDGWPWAALDAIPDEDPKIPLPQDAVQIPEGTRRRRPKDDLMPPFREPVRPAAVQRELVLESTGSRALLLDRPPMPVQRELVLESTANRAKEMQHDDDDGPWCSWAEMEKQLGDEQKTTCPPESTETADDWPPWAEEDGSSREESGGKEEWKQGEQPAPWSPAWREEASSGSRKLPSSGGAPATEEPGPKERVNADELRAADAEDGLSDGSLEVDAATMSIAAQES
eukprot:TRINITY_DN32575_c0_g1_i1.p1 TRINITY_DN32575_c0_g1~~TRINITY_DN32575_c0_g1_i1.p1  ORF type:complete len:636 (-),score=145.01 TRINITY_DN32575_c0_g1_i1:10-1917(-)